MRDRSNTVGLRLIVGYKLAKAVAELLLGIFLLVATSAGLDEQMQAVALNVRHHAAAAWSIAVAKRLIQVTTERNLRIVTLAALLDGASSAFEGWALHRRYRWSRWLIVGATSCLLPFEGVAIMRHVSALRIALFFVNALVVIYLARRRVATAKASGLRSGLM